MKAMPLRPSRGLLFFCLPCTLVCLAGLTPLQAQDEVANEKQKTVYSGPQTGEALPAIPVWLMSQPTDKPNPNDEGPKVETAPSSQVNLTEHNAKGPIVVAFIHEKSRPAFQLARIMSAFAATKKEQKLQLTFVVLTDDRSSSEKWLGQIRGYMDASTQFAVAEGGLEGPGGLGLNRLVQMTILVAKDQKVTANFALTQVTSETDAPDILKAMNEVSGGGEIPPMKDFLPSPNRPARTR